MHNSAIEEIVQAWNRLPPDLAALSYDSLKKTLRLTKYADRLNPVTIDMSSTIRTL
jgi:hypothetical protein